MSLHIVNFGFTGADQSITAPANIYQGLVTVTLAGAGGGGAPGGRAGGTGGVLHGVVAVNSGDTILIRVGAGATGTAYGAHTGGAGGSGGQGAGGRGGCSSSLLVNGNFVYEAPGGGGAGSGDNSGFSLYGGLGGSINGGVGLNGSQGDGPGSNIGGIGGGAGTGANGGGGAAASGGGSGGGAGSANGGGGGNGGAFSSTTGGGGGGGGAGYWGGGGGAGGYAAGSGAGGGGGAGNWASYGTYTQPPVWSGSTPQGQPGSAGLTWLVQPVVTVTAPTGTVTNTVEPSITWTYAQADGGALERYWVKIFTDPAGGWPAGFDPNTGNYTGSTTPLVPIWDSGEVFTSSSGPISIPVPLPNANYHAFLKAKDVGGNGLYSNWVSTNWIENVPGPLTPGLVAMAEIPNDRVHLQSSVQGNMLTAQAASFEDSGTVAPYTGGSCSVSTTAGHAVAGLRSMQLQATAASNISASTIPTNAYPVLPNTTYSAYASVLAQATGVATTVTINWYTAANTFFNSSAGAGVTSNTSTFVQATVTATSPAVAAFATVTITMGPVALNSIYWVDQVGLFAGSLAISSSSLEIQRSADGGVTWVSPPYLLNILFSGSLVDSYDTEAPREIPLLYRIRGHAVNLGLPVVSAWSTPVATRLNSDNNEWLHSLDPTLDGPVIRQGPDMVGGSHEDQFVYYPEGRSDPVVMAGTIHLESFGNPTGGTILTFAFPDNTSWQRFVAMRARQDPLLLKTVYGEKAGPLPLEQYWIRVGPDLTTTRVGGGNLPYQTGAVGLTQIRTVTVAAVVVARPVR